MQLKFNRPARCALFAIACSVLVLRQPLTAQHVTAIAELPDAPSASPGASDPVPGTANLSGKVTGPNGTPIEGAAVTLKAAEGSTRDLVTDAQGLFLFRSVTPGTFNLTVSSPGLQSYNNPELTIKPNESRILPPIVLPLVGDTAVVHVNASAVEVAQAQLKEAEKQRVLGVLPNFYTSYIWDAAPLNAHQKFDLATHSVFDPVGFAAIGLVAGSEQASNAYGQYGQGAQGYAKRFGADYADVFIGRMLSSAVLPSLLHQDPRYFYKGTGTTRQRAVYALSRIVVTRGDDGHAEFNYSRIFGDFGAGAISNAYRPSNDRGFGLTITNGFIDLAGNAADNLLREFILRRVTHNVPDYSQGNKPATPSSQPQK
jgi:hypothetical protein